MEWQYALILILGGLIFLMAMGLQIAFCFLFVNLLGAIFLFGGEAGLRQLTLSIFSSLSTFSLLPLPLFILMGEVMFQSGLASHMMDALDKWLGRLPGRLGLLAVCAGTLFATLTGASMGSSAMLGSTLVPEMEKRGYKKPMSLGPVLGSGGLAIMIPPSGLAILLGAIGEISIGKLLIAIILPGLVMAFLYATYIIGRCMLQPSIAPPYDIPPSTLSEKLVGTVWYILPLGLIVFLVVGVIFMGVASPTEAAATGAFGMFGLTAMYRRLNWDVTKKAIRATVQITVMMFLIIASAKAFSQNLAASGASRGLVEFVSSLPLSPLLVVIAMQIVFLFLGMFMTSVAMTLIAIPLFMPIIRILGFDPVWFGVITLLNMEMAQTSPPFGMSLFVLKGVAPPDTTMEDLYKAALPFLYCDLIVMALLIAFPAFSLWLPGLMR